MLATFRRLINTIYYYHYYKLCFIDIMYLSNRFLISKLSAVFKMSGYFRAYCIHELHYVDSDSKLWSLHCIFPLSMQSRAFTCWRNITLYEVSNFVEGFYSYHVFTINWFLLSKLSAVFKVCEYCSAYCIYALYSVK